MVQIMHFLHITSAVILVGLPIASYFYLSFTYHKHYLISHFTLKLVTLLDVFLLPLVLFVAITGFNMGIPLNTAMTTPWILSSSIYLLFAVLCIVINLVLKAKYYVKLHFTGLYKLSYLFHGINILEIVLLILITHDMTIKQTWIVAA